MRVAGVDLGTNSARLLIADVGPDGPLVTVERRMRITRLGEGVQATRRLGSEAIERNLVVLGEYATLIRALGVESVRATATSAARDATNHEEFFGPAEEVLGTPLELLAAEDEAALSFLGATADLDPLAAPPQYLVVDIGGGSTEFIVGTTEPEALVSVDVGCVRLTEQFLETDPPTPEELSQAVTVVRDHMTDVARELGGIGEVKTVIGLAGTVTTVAAIELGLAVYDRAAIHHYRLSRAAAEDVFRTLATEAADDRRHNPGLEPGRVDVIVGGAIVLAAFMRAFRVDEMLVSEADVLDGLVLSQRPT